MTKIRRINNIIIGLIMIVTAILLIRYPQEGYNVILLFLTIALIFSGIASLYYYFSMARFMVGGKVSLYKGVILINLGIFTGSLENVSHVYILVYLALIHAFSGLVEILHANESRKYGAKSWKLKFSHGIINVLMALACVFFMKQQNTAVIIYCLGLLYSGIIRIITAFRKTTFIYIQ